MPHDHLKGSVRTQTGRASVLLIATLMGGVLVLCSFLADWAFADARLRAEGGGTQNFYADLLALIGAMLLGAPLAWHAVKHLYRGELHMDELVAMAIVAAIATGAYQEAGVIAFFMILSTQIEHRTALGARAAIEELARETPHEACLLSDDGIESTVETRNLRPGQIVRVRPGENIPADGTILKGDSTVNEANITGESLPRDKNVGEEVFSGTTNLTGAIDVKVTKAGEDTRLGQVQRLLVDAERTKIPLMRLIDQYAGWYTPTILMIACIVLYFTRDINRAVSMLVVACPCALVLATPTAMVAALSCAARLKIFIKNVIHLESARNLTAMVLDKTGTLTTGNLTVTRMKPAPGVEGADLLSAAAAVEQMSNHPVAQAVKAKALEARLDLIHPEGFEETPGQGTAGKVEGQEVRVGRATWLAEGGADMSITEDAAYQEPEGLSVLYVTKGGKCIGWIGLEDRTRPEARQAIDGLRELGLRQLTMVTGDRWSVARRVSHEMGCSDVQAEVFPEQKLEIVDGLKRSGHKVAVVGDGVNDAPALAAGDLGIAMGAAGSDVAVNSASIALMSSDLSLLPFIVKLSRATTSVIWQNLIFGLAFIIAGEALAAFGKVPTMLAAVLHTVASVIVVFNSAPLVRFREERHPAPPTTPPPARAPVASATA